MGVSIETKHKESYYLAKWQGRITDAVLLKAYEDFFKSTEWVPGHDSLVDQSELDATELTSYGLQSLQSLVKRTFAPHNIHPKIAVYAIHDLPYGLSRMYSARVEDYESHAVFREKTEAIKWLKKDQCSES